MDPIFDYVAAGGEDKIVVPDLRLRPAGSRPAGSGLETKRASDPALPFLPRPSESRIAFALRGLSDVIDGVLHGVMLRLHLGILLYRIRVSALFLPS